MVGWFFFLILAPVIAWLSGSSLDPRGSDEYEELLREREYQREKAKEEWEWSSF